MFNSSKMKREILDYTKMKDEAKLTTSDIYLKKKM